MLRRIFTVLLFFSFVLVFQSLHANNPFFKTFSKSAFIENKGQIIDQDYKSNPTVLYLLNSPGFNVQLRRDGFSYDVYQVHSRQSAVGNKSSRVTRHVTAIW
jgi:hypothetical protein